MRLRALGIDGGELRGIYTAAYLNTFEHALRKRGRYPTYHASFEIGAIGGHR